MTVKCLGKPVAGDYGRLEPGKTYHHIPPHREDQLVRNGKVIRIYPAGEIERAAAEVAKSAAGRPTKAAQSGGRSGATTSSSSSQAGRARKTTRSKKSKAKRAS